MVDSHHVRKLGIYKTIGVIATVHAGDSYPCVVKPIWREDGIDLLSTFSVKPAELIYFGIAKEKNKFCPSSVFAFRPKTASVELLG